MGAKYAPIRVGREGGGPKSVQKLRNKFNGRGGCRRDFRMKSLLYFATRGERREKRSAF